jgi:enediyne biosynthesis protein E4
MRFRSRPFRARAIYLLLAMILGLAGCENPDPPDPVLISGPPSLVIDDGTTTEVVFPAPTREIPGDVGDIRVNHAPVQIQMTKQTDPSPFRFAEIAEQAGIDFVHTSGMTEAKHYPTTNGSGVAMFDYDGDGKLDLYFATATYLPLGSRKTGPNKLYKNLGQGKFKDVTEASGLGFAGFCHGIVVGDIDNDGDQDVFLCNYGPNALYLNNGNGTFTDISESAGVTRFGWSSGGAMLDIDNDGDLDIYIANYGQWKLPDDDKYCGDPSRRARTYCSPHQIKTTKHYLYRNNGDHTFTDVLDKVIYDPIKKVFRARDDGRGFGVVTADVDGDGRIDIYVANDMCPNFLFRNRGDGTFEDATESSGAAYNDKGKPQSGMGVDAEDLDGDGLPDLFVTNFDAEYNTLYRNLGGGQFRDVGFESGLGRDTLPWVGWGTALADFDNDGWPDNFVANGQVDDNLRLMGRNLDYEEPALLFRNQEGKRFRLATRDAGPYFESRHVGRGAAFGDFDDDGDIDIVVNHKDGAPAVLRNDAVNANHWIRLELRGTKSNRDAVGARIEVVAGGRKLLRQRKGGYSMESSNDPRILIGIGKADEVETLVVRWPSGAITKQEHLKPGRNYSLVEPADAASGPSQPSTQRR